MIKLIHEFVTILSTKGPTAYYTFVNEVLGRLNNTVRDQELYEELIQKLPTRKRRASTSVVEYAKLYVRLSKYHPHFLKASKGIRMTKYMEEFRLIRKYEQMEENERRISDSILNRLISSPDTPLRKKKKI